MKKNIFLMLMSSLILVPNAMAMRKASNVEKPTTTITKPSEETVENNPKADNDILIIFYDAQIGDKALIEAIANNNAKLVYRYDNMNGVAIKKPADKTLEEAISIFQNVEGVISVQENEIMTIQ